MVNKVAVVIVYGAWKIHHVPCVSIIHWRQHECIAGFDLAGPEGDTRGAQDVKIERQLRTVLLDGPAGKDAYLS